MATTQPHLEITDGTTSVKLMDSAATTPALIAAMNYRLSFEGWAPKIARRNKNPLGLPYTRVLEELTIDIRGSTPDVCYSKLQALNTLLDQGERWFNNEIVNPVFVRYQPLGSTKATYMSDVVIGGAASDDGAEMLTIPDDFNVTGFISYLKGVRVRFWRRIGTWLCEVETITDNANAQDTPGSVTWSDFATVLSPIDIEIGGNSASDNITSGYTLVAHNDAYIKVFLGTSLGGVGVNDAASFPTGAQINRITGVPTALLELQTLTSMPIKECEYYAVYAKVRNNSTTVDAYIRGIQLNPEISGQDVKVPFAGTPLPTVVFLGVFPTRGRTPGNVAGGEFDLYIYAASGNLNFDVDSMAVLMLNRASNAIAGTEVTHFTIASNDHIQIRNRLLLEPQALYAVNTPPDDIPQTYSGTAYCFTGGIGTTRETAVLEYFTDGGSWTILNSARSAKITIDYKVTRYKAYLTPE